MVRAPCCDKMGLKKGPWTPQEDKILISHIQKYGHSNWRQLPKQAGLLRCGKSCRLRWINYLRPDIKRGNFTQEEEETIIKLHELLGSRWSAIAAHLPGRTDNEIKNVWHTHLKKRLGHKQDCNKGCDHVVNMQSQNEDSNISTLPRSNKISSPMSPQPSRSDVSTLSEVTTATQETSMIKKESLDSSTSEIFPLIDEEFWSEPEFVTDNSSMGCRVFHGLLFESGMQSGYLSNDPNITDNGMEFWYNVFVKAGEVEELL